MELLSYTDIKNYGTIDYVSAGIFWFRLGQRTGESSVNQPFVGTT